MHIFAVSNSKYRFSLGISSFLLHTVMLAELRPQTVGLLVLVVLVFFFAARVQLEVYRGLGAPGC